MSDAIIYGRHKSLPPADAAAQVSAAPAGKKKYPRLGQTSQIPASAVPDAVQAETAQTRRI